MHLLSSNLHSIPLLLVVWDKLNIINMQETMNMNSVGLILKCEYLFNLIHLYTRRVRIFQSHLSWKMDVFQYDLLLFSTLNNQNIFQFGKEHECRLIFDKFVLSSLEILRVETQLKRTCIQFVQEVFLYSFQKHSCPSNFQQLYKILC